MQTHVKKALLMNGAIILGSCLVFALFYYVLGNDLSAQSQKIISDKTVINERTRAAESLALLRRNELDAKAYQTKINLLLPLQDELLHFPEFVDSLARTANVGLTFNFQGSPVAATPTAPGYIAFTISVGGPLDSLMNFLNAVESKSQRFIMVLDNFDLNRSENGYRVVSQGKVFFQ